MKFNHFPINRRSPLVGDAPALMRNVDLNKTHRSRASSYEYIVFAKGSIHVRLLS